MYNHAKHKKIAVMVVNTFLVKGFIKEMPDFKRRHLGNKLVLSAKRLPNA